MLLGFLPGRRAEIFAGRLTRIPKVGGSLAELWRAVWLYRCRGRGVGLALLLVAAVFVALPTAAGRWDMHVWRWPSRRGLTYGELVNNTENLIRNLPTAPQTGGLDSAILAAAQTTIKDRTSAPWSLS